MKFPWKSNEGDGGASGYYDTETVSSGPPLEAVITIPIRPGAAAGVKGTESTEKPSGSDYSHLLSPLYAILMVLIGLLLPMTEALQDQWHMTIYNMIYNVYSLGVAILSVIFLQWLLLHQRHHYEPDNDTSTLKPASSVDMLYDANDATEIVLPSITIVPPSPLSSDVDNDDDEVKENSSPAPTDSTPAAADQPASPVTDLSSDDDALPPPASASGPRRHSEASACVLQMINEQRRFSVSATSAKSATAGGVTAKIRLGGSAEREAGRKMSADDDIEEIEQEAWIDLMKLGSVFSHEGSNLYLRLWQLGFALGNVVYIIIEIQFQMSVTTVACSGTYGWTFVFRLAFIVTQTFFLFKNQTMEVKTREVLVRFALMHLIATNTSVWLRTLINEIMFEYKHFTHHSDDHGTAVNSTPGHVMTGDCEKFDKLIETTSPFLFPFVLEYSLIAMGTLAIMYSAVDEATDEQANTLRRIQNLFRVPALSANYADDHDAAPILQKSHRGFFTGILVLSGGFVGIIMFYFATTETSKVLIYLVTLISLHSVMLLATGVAIVKINQLSYIARPVSVDDILLLLSMSGEVVYELSIIMASSNYVAMHAGSHQPHDTAVSQHEMSTTMYDTLHSGSDSDERLLSETLRLVASGVAVIQAVIQVLLTISGLRRYPLSQSHLEEMPGRGVITFLIVANVTVWICRTALVKALSSDTMIDYYTTLPWLLLANINLPLLLFYRFHSSFCLADIWHSAYTYPSASEHGGPKHKEPKPAAVRHRSTAVNRTALDEDKVAASNGVIKRYTMSND